MRSAEACYRWTYVSIDGSIGREIFSAPYPIPLHPPPRAVHGPFLLVRRASRRHRDNTWAGERRTRVPRDRRGPSLLSRDGFTRSLSFVSLFMKSRGERERDGRRLRAPAIPDVGPVELIKTSGIMRERAPRSRDFAGRMASRDTCFTITEGSLVAV